MAFDAYALCPGGREKKIKFCCPDMLKELEQVNQLMETEQTAACLNFLDQLEEKHPNCACLAAARLAMLRMENRYDEALRAAKEFAAREPDNMLAVSELAMATAVTGDPKAALDMLIDAIEKGAEGTIHSSLLIALYIVGSQLLAAGRVLPAIGIGHQLRSVDAMAQQGNTLIYHAMSVTEIPLVLRETRFEMRCPDNFPAKDAFSTAARQLRSGRWKQALAAFEGMTEHAAAWPILWRNIAVVRLWLLDDEGAAAALGKYCEFTDQPFEDLADAAFMRICLLPDPLGDLMAIQGREYTIEKPDEAQEAMLSAPCFYRIDVDPRQFAQGDAPPPKNVFALLDRPFPPAGTAPTLDNTPSQLAAALFYGRQTDRPARLMVIEMPETALVGVDNLVRNTIGSMLGNVAEPQPTRQVSQTQSSIQFAFRFRPEAMPNSEQLETLIMEFYEKRFIPEFCDRPIGLLDGKSPGQVAGDPTYRVRLLGLMEVIDGTMSPELAVEACTKLRERLGLPVPGPVALPDPCPSGDEAVRFLESVPVWRWYRFEVEKMSTDMLLRATRMVEVAKDVRCLTRFSEEILARPINSMPNEARFLAFDTLIRVAQAEQNFEEAITWIDRAKSESAEMKVSAAPWKIASVGIYLAMGEGDKAQDAVQDVVTHHSQEPEAMQMLQELFVGLGLMNPDGTPRGPAGAGMAAGSTPPGTPGAAAPEPKPASSGLWTPDSEAGGGSGTASKLWTPD